MQSFHHLLFAILAPVLFPLLLFGQEKPAFSSDLKTEKKPWTHLDFENDPYHFQFAIVTDRTGSPRAGIFEDAVEKLNWLRPEFVMSVGDLIRGAKGQDSVALAEQWAGHFERIRPLKMPFFHLAGNHDIKANNDFQVEYWNKLFGTPFYSFRYKDVLFLCLFTNEGFQEMTDEQISYFKEVLESNQDVRWTLLFMHHPLWVYPHDSKFDQLEALLKGRKHTVFAGHHHRYHHYERNASNYYVLATTGGGSGLLGNSFGMFDHITWVTMTESGPMMANLRLDGILPHDVSNDETMVLSRALINGVFFDSDVFVDSREHFQKGLALMTYTNNSDLPLYLKGQFFHNHHVQAFPSELDVEIPPHAQKTIEIKLKAIQPFNLEDKILLDLEGSLGYNHPEYPDLKLSGTNSIKLEVSDYDILRTKEVDFVDEFNVVMAPALPGTTIRYTLDGSDPTTESAVYESPFSVSRSITIKARLFTEEGMTSEVDKLSAHLVEPGLGLLCKYYEYDNRKGNWYKVPDFADFQPTTIKVTQSLDLEKAGERNQFFGVVYEGFIDLPETGKYTFSTISDDGSILFIDGKPVVVDEVKHKPREVFGNATLEKGKHAYEVHFFQHKKGMVMDVFFETPSGKRQKVDISMLTFGLQAPVSKVQRRDQ